MSIEHSMQDLDSAVGRLDNILMTIYVIVAMLIIAVALVTSLFNVPSPVPSFFFYRKLNYSHSLLVLAPWF